MARWLYGSNEAKKNEKLQLSMAQLGADVKRSLLVAVPEALPTGTHPCKFFSLITGCPEANLTIHGALDDYYCIELQPPTSVEEKHDEVSSEESSGSSQVEKKEKKEKKNKMDNDKNKEKHDEVSSEERSGSSQVR
ncbi:unnamed protein product [Durusdinium trenchii]|uniref:Nucleoplasmin-like domain-containing protein n=1 Tax=Durusdinium trenchii TaxID=1381693 RepID=A0ABP0RX42_9DINO